MIDEVTRTPEAWCRLTGWRILDPDGWDRTNFAEDWARPLTLEEFERKAMMSTAMKDEAGVLPKWSDLFGIAPDLPPLPVTVEVPAASLDGLFVAPDAEGRLCVGYRNNNCIGCVKGGMGYWNKIRGDFPETFDRMAGLERRLGHTVLRDDEGPVWLDELDPGRGNHQDEAAVECSLLCAIAEDEIGGPDARA